MAAHLQGLDISAEARNAHHGQVVNFEYALEVAINRHQFGGESRVRGDRDAVLAGHGEHAVSVVRVELQFLVSEMLSPESHVRPFYFYKLIPNK